MPPVKSLDTLMKLLADLCATSCLVRICRDSIQNSKICAGLSLHLPQGGLPDTRDGGDGEQGCLSEIL